MTDEILDALRSDWMNAETDSLALAARYRARRTKMARHLRLAYAAPVAILTGLVSMGWLAFALHDLLYGVAALAFIGGLPVSIVSLRIARYDVKIRYDETPEGHLLQMRHWLSAELRLLHSARWVAGILVLALALALCLPVLGHVSIVTALFLSLIWGATAAAVSWWQHHQRRRLQYELASIEGLLHDLEIP
jgi:hypothetical protein